MHDTEIVGRDEELRVVSSFLEQSPATGALLIEGGPGIGKTTLWRFGVKHAVEHGWQVLTAGPAASEARLAFAAIGDLLGGSVHQVVSRLAPPQQHALEVALLLEAVRGRPPEKRAVAVAVLEALRALAEERPETTALRPNARASVGRCRGGESPAARPASSRVTVGGRAPAARSARPPTPCLDPLGPPQPPCAAAPPPAQQPAVPLARRRPLPAHWPAGHRVRLLVTLRWKPSGM